MGKDKILKLILRKSTGGEFVAPWNYRPDGRPTPANIERWRQGFNASLLKGGANEHLGASHWLLCSLEIFNQLTGEVVARNEGPAFEVIPSNEEYELYEDLPAEVQAIIDEVAPDDELIDTYEQCAAVVDKLAAIGYRADYDLNAMLTIYKK